MQMKNKKQRKEERITKHMENKYKLRIKNKNDNKIQKYTNYENHINKNTQQRKQ